MDHISRKKGAEGDFLEPPEVWGELSDWPSAGPTAITPWASPLPGDHPAALPTVIFPSSQTTSDGTQREGHPILSQNLSHTMLVKLKKNRDHYWDQHVGEQLLSGSCYRTPGAETEACRVAAFCPHNAWTHGLHPLFCTVGTQLSVNLKSVHVSTRTSNSSPPSQCVLTATQKVDGEKMKSCRVIKTSFENREIQTWHVSVSLLRQRRYQYNLIIHTQES